MTAPLRLIVNTCEARQERVQGVPCGRAGKDRANAERVGQTAKPGPSPDVLRLIVNNKVSPHNFWVASGEEQQTAHALRAHAGSRQSGRHSSRHGPDSTSTVPSLRRAVLVLLPQNAETPGADTPGVPYDVA